MSNNANLFTTITFLQNLPQITAGAAFTAFVDQANQAAAKIDSLTNSVATLEQIIGLPLAKLNTPTNSSIVDAVNAAIQQTNVTSVLGDITQLITTNKTSLVAAINELDTNKVDSSSITSFMGSLLSSITTTLGLSAAIGNLPISQVTNLQSSLDTLTAGVTAKMNITDVNSALALTEKTANKNIANGYAGLDVNGLIPAALVPAARSGHTFSVASQAAMLALTAAVQGDLAVRTDLSETFILSGNDPTVLGNWIQFLTPSSPVSSVAGRTGAVVLSTTDIGGLTTALSALLPLTGGTISGALTVSGLATLGSLSTPNASITTSGGVSTAIGSKVIMTVNGTQWRLLDNSGTTRGVSVDLNALGGNSIWGLWHAGNLNPANFTTSSQLTTALVGYLQQTGGTITGNLTVNGTFTFQGNGTFNNDITVQVASSPTHGGIFFGNSGTKKLSADGTNLSVTGLNLVANGGTVYSTGNLNTSGFVTTTGLANTLSGYLPLNGGVMTGQLVMHDVSADVGYIYFGNAYIEWTNSNWVFAGPGGTNGAVGDLVGPNGACAPYSWVNNSFPQFGYINAHCIGGIRYVATDSFGSGILQAALVNGPWTFVASFTFPNTSSGGGGGIGSGN